MIIADEGHDLVLDQHRKYGLDYDGNRANHLGNGLDLAEDACRNDNTALARNNKAKACDTKLAKENDKHYPYENNGESRLISQEHPYENGDHRGKHHKFVRKGIDKLAEIGDEIILSCDLAVKHIGKSRDYIDERGNDKSPYAHIPHK